MPLEIPVVPSVPDYEFDSLVDGFQLRFEFRWNLIASAWYMTVREQNGDPIVVGVRVVRGMYLGRRSFHPFFRTHVLVVDGDEEAGLDTFGESVKLLCYTDEEVMAGRGFSGT